MKFNKAFDIFEKLYFYTIGIIIALCVGLGLIEGVKSAFVAAPWFWVFLGIGVLYVAFLGLIIHIINKYFNNGKVLKVTK